MKSYFLEDVRTKTGCRVYAMGDIPYYEAQRKLGVIFDPKMKEERFIRLSMFEKALFLRALGHGSFHIFDKSYYTETKLIESFKVITKDEK